MATDRQKQRILVAGAGLIGCFVGGLLAAGGHDVHFLLRPGASRRHGALRCIPFKGQVGSAERVSFTDDAAIAATADLVLVCVKSGATADVAARLRGHLRAGIPVLSLQNGIENAARLRQALPEATVLAGLVSFNVVSDAEGSYRQATSGGIFIEAGLPAVLPILQCDGLTVADAPDILRLQWGKLLLNLNNALVALSDLTLRDELRRRPWRLLLARQIEEALAALSAAGIQPLMPGGKTPQAVLSILRLPDWLYRIISVVALRVDARARSSMWEDLQQKRLTEIDELQGAILRLAESRGGAAPLNARVLELVHEAEAGRIKPPLRAEEI